ncbi:hypothetical protein A2U01_0060717, partial [Trifolium medium]|nr:hypothetical protein [Trifolium medium]
GSVFLNSSNTMEDFSRLATKYQNILRFQKNFLCLVNIHLISSPCSCKYSAVSPTENDTTGNLSLPREYSVLFTFILVLQLTSANQSVKILLDIFI